MLPVSDPDINEIQLQLDRSTFLQIHALPLIVAWLLLIPLACITARFGTRWTLWFPVHLVLTIVATIITFVAAGFGLAHSEGRHLQGVHRKLGVTTLVALGIQILLGILISVTYKETRKRTPIIDKIHWWLGRSTVLIAFATIDIGLIWTKMPSMTIISIIIFQFVLVTLYSFLVIFLP